VTSGDLDFARFPIELDINAPADTVVQVGIVNTLFPSGTFDLVIAKILPITGTGGKSKGAVFVFARET